MTYIDQAGEHALRLIIGVSAMAIGAGVIHLVLESLSLFNTGTIITFIIILGLLSLSYMAGTDILEVIRE